MGELDEITREFLLESREGLDQLERDLVSLEETPGDREIVARIFRCFHTIKGTSGFLGFANLEGLAHAGESLLSRLREGTLTLTEDMTSAMLVTVDGLTTMLGIVEATGGDGTEDYQALRDLLAGLCENQPPPQVTERGAIGKRPSARSGKSQPAPEPLPSEPADPSLRPSARAATSQLVHSLRPLEAGADRAAAQTRGAAAESVRVDVGLLDNLMDLAGELVLVRNHFAQIVRSADDPTLTRASQRLNLVTSQLQGGIMQMRMQPVASSFNKLPRMVREVARSCKKLVQLEVDARNTELDKSLIEAIKDPMVHLLRNCIDHGIEAPEVRKAAGKNPEGHIVIRALHQNGLVHIEVSDDGGGIPLDKVRKIAVSRGLLTPERAGSLSDSEAAALIFLPGFSTASEVTNLSGRGVGMDVVKNNVEQIGGAVEVETRAGQGTTFTLKIPLTLAIVPAMIMRCGQERYAIPQVNVVEMLRLDPAPDKPRIESFHGAPVLRLRGRLLPVLMLAKELNVDDEGTPAAHLAVVQAAGRHFGVVVDAILDQQEIVVKPMPDQLKNLQVFAGATLLGNGRVALILDVLGLAQRAGLVSEPRDDAAAQARSGAAGSRGPLTLLLFSGQGDSRYALALDDLTRLETLARSTVEATGAWEVVQYRGDIMPLVEVSELLPPRPSQLRSASPAPAVSSADLIDVIVLGNSGRQLGMVVSDVLDVVETSVPLQMEGCRRGVTGTLVLHGRVTELVDAEWILASTLGKAARARAALETVTAD
jgi:two-component system, chemotaxis family, sensor kinase CheA